MKKKAAKHPSTTAPKKRIFIVEDHPVFREGLVQILNGENDLIVCGEAGSAEQALGEITRLSPDLAHRTGIPVHVVQSSACPATRA